MDFLSAISDKDELNAFLNIAIDSILRKEIPKKFSKHTTELDYISNIYTQYCSSQLTKPELLEYFPVENDLKDLIFKAIETRKPQVCQQLVNLHNSSNIPLMTSFDWDLKFIVGNSSLASFREQRATLILNCKKSKGNDNFSVEMNREMLDKLITELEK